MSLKQKAQNLRRISVEKIVARNLKNNEAELVDLNTSQLYSGVDANGQSLGEYSPFTKELKQAKGQPTDRITLKDEGDFYDGFGLVRNDFPFLLTSSDSKTSELTQMYGEKIFGLTAENWKEYIQGILLPFVQDDFKAEISKALR